MKRRHIPPVRKPVKNNLTTGTAKQLSEMLQRGLANHQQGNIKGAVDIYEKILNENPNYFGALQLLGTGYYQLGNYFKALELFERAILINPNYPALYNNRGNALQDLKRLDEALLSFNKAITLKPDYAEAHYNRGNTLNDLKRLDEALASYDMAIALKPDYTEAYSNRGNTLQDLKRLDEALASYDMAIALKLDYAEVYWNKSLLMILTGKYQEGWKLYEWRLAKEDIAKNYYQFPQVSWRGQDSVEGKRILIHSEQGFGDVIQFCRYLPKVKSLGAEIIFEVPKTLVPLVSTLDCPMTIIAKGDPLPEFDAYCPIMSLPYVFKTTIETIPSDTPYLYANKDKIKDWEDKLGQKDRLRVGIVWSGSSSNKNDQNRSIPLERLLPLLGLPVEWHSLQKEYREFDLSALDQHPEIQRHENNLHDFSDTAALIDCMDLVISVDTSVAHVAGAIGIPVWIMLPWFPDFRWMFDREDSPWYPTAKLFRQQKRADWESVIESIQKSLVKMLQES